MQEGAPPSGERAPLFFLEDGMWQKGLRALVVPLVFAALWGCQRAGEAGPTPQALPPGMCACPCDVPSPYQTTTPNGANGHPTATATAAGDLDVGEVLAVATRKMMHNDGAGCLAELDLVARANPKLDARMAMVRAQCEMLAGRCQDGKRRVVAYYSEEMNFSPEMADKSAEALASMRCKGGDASPRDALLRAFYGLSEGAYMTTKTPADCRRSLDDAKRLIPQVPPKEFDDGQVTGGAQALFFTSAQCFARAGDCQGAWQAYRDNYPTKNLSATLDPALVDKVIRDGFTSSVERCKGGGITP